MISLRLNDIWKQVVRWFRAEPAVLMLPQYEPPPTADPKPQWTLPVPTAIPEAKPLSPNRHTRRALNKDRRAMERARRKFDKFVTPKGPEPVHFLREEQEPDKIKPVVEQPEVQIFDDPNDHYIVDEWLEGDGSQVLYEESEFFGEFNFRDTILDQLERYWVYLERMKKHDVDAYEFYKQIGAVLVPYVATSTHSDKAHKFTKVRTPEEMERYKKEIVLPPYFKTHWPAFGCVAFGTNPRDEAAEKDRDHAPDGRRLWIPKFMYFRRVVSMPWTVQPVRGGKLYMLTVWWDRPHEPVGRGHRWGTPQEFPFQIIDDKIRILKTRMASSGKIRRWYDWRIPHDYREWSQQHGLTAELHLTHMFCDAVKHCEFANYAMVRVSVSKDDLTAVFGISARRTSYFFQDRDYTLTIKGRRERIFHMVRAHVRKDGTKVPTSFRGKREFEWAGYHVKLTVPGRDHFMLPDFNVPMHYTNSRKVPKESSVSEREVAQRIKRLMDEGGGAVH